MAEMSTLQRTDSRILQEQLKPWFTEGANFPITEAGGVLYIEVPSRSSSGDVGYISPSPQARLDFSNVKWFEDLQYREFDLYLQGQNAIHPRSRETSKSRLPGQNISILSKNIAAWLDKSPPYFELIKATFLRDLPSSKALRNYLAHGSAGANKNFQIELQHLLRSWQEQVADHGGQKQLAAKLQASFEENPVEDGMEHPAEEIIASTLAETKVSHVLSWFRAFCADASQPSFAASVLRCLGRCERIGTVTWRVGLVRDGLAMNDVEIRDAAVQAAESWRDVEMVECLRAHDEPEPWLRQYVLDVIEDLTT